MPRLPHGRPITEDQINAARDDLADLSTRAPLLFALSGPPPTGRFDLLFPGLQDDEANLVEQTAQTPARLAALGTAMADPDTGPDSPIPAAYTYFGQFVDHDITLEIQQPGSGTMRELLDPAMSPLPQALVRKALRNRRTATLDLDSVYGEPAPRDPANRNKLLVGPVADAGADTGVTKPVPDKGRDNDLPREGRSADIEHDRAALIGDPRNDENLIIAQLHVAFLKAHNRLVDTGLSFEGARRVLRQHYQHIVVRDFLRLVCEPGIVDDIVKKGNRWYDPFSPSFFMPLEFSVGAYRFGHSMVRGSYDFNLNFPRASLQLLFTFTALGGQLGGSDTLPDNWIIQWERIIGDRAQKARKIDTSLARVGNQALFALQTVDGQTETPDLAARLAVRNLLRGYRLRLPTGQALAHHLGLAVLSKDDVLAASGGGDQAAALTAGGFETRTPLWYYVLAEAKHFHDGARLGPVGSTLVAEVLVGLVRRSEDSILKVPSWQPTLPSAKAGTFELADLLRLAGVLPGATQPPRTYTVKAGDSLFRIAERELGDGNRWTEIFLLNRSAIRDPNRIFPGQVFVLPPARPSGPVPRLHTVKRGDTLSGIARAELGDPNRWPEIFALNRDVLSNPDRIIPGQILAVPAR
ncbi:LysM peptidoglycan-binding domain-containing protein [Actinoplanes sp. NBRC 101535]|uniref:LysM peptidoglycan-binding domain-containing protein n=1 Tax=Actinoplanes sp. NBRC 101535 TaxID=3032196 RepID=UPI0024A2D809|nr:LysM peptidoglycan-binding domain-containing protein [Actinoplanes sp. NBRC 101535]GLY06329.1 hypothetical protein Acsp01_67080 [Actinoplanes sp. NBRC 101535]